MQLFFSLLLMLCSPVLLVAYALPHLLTTQPRHTLQ